MDVGRIKNLVTLAVMNFLPMRFYVWALHIAACQVGKGMRNKIVSPVMDPYEMRLYDILLIHLASLKNPSISVEWMRDEARNAIGRDVIELNEAATMDRILTFIQQNPAASDHFFKNQN